MKIIKSIFQKNISYHLSIVLALFMLFMYAPYEMYITNSNEFWFGLKDFLPFLILFCIVIFLIVEIILFFLPSKIADVISLLAFGLGLCTYIQGNFLGIDIGVLNGKFTDYGLYKSYYVRDIIVWFIVLAAILAAYIFIKKYCFKVTNSISAFVIIMLTITGVVLMLSSGNKHKASSSVCSDENLVTFGSDENVVVFLLDMFDSEYMDSIIEHYPELVEKLDGFTFYRNCTGAYATTDCSLAYLASGTYNRNQYDSVYSFIDSFDRLYYDALIENGYALDIYGMSSVPSRLKSSISNQKDLDISVSSRGKFLFHIIEMGGMKFFPNYFKRYVDGFEEQLNNDKVIKSDYEEYESDNVDANNNICSKEPEINGDKRFKWIYAYGAHYPYNNDEECNRVDVNYERPVQQAAGALKMVENYLEKMQEMGVYDSANVVIMADHGYYWDDGKKMFTKPLMLIKKAGDKGELTINNAPVDQGNYAATVDYMITGNLENEFGRSIEDYAEDEDRQDRMFYYYYLNEHADNPMMLNRRLIEFTIGQDANSEDAYEMTGVEYTVNGTKINHADYCKTCIEKNDNPIHEKADNYPGD